MPTFVCPECGRTVEEEPISVTTDSRSQQEAAEAVGHPQVTAAPACQEGHAPMPMQPKG